MPEKMRAGDITELLHRWGAGDRAVENELFALVLPNLRNLASYFMKGERPGHLLQPTDLVDTIYLKLANVKDINWRDRQHFFAFAARAMRWHLIDIARRERRMKPVALDELSEPLLADSARWDQEIMLARLLDELAGIRPDWCMVVEAKHYLGLTDEEGAEMLGMKQRTFQRMWMDAKHWLFERMEARARSGSSAGR
jgi:RNA polymerase sigma factor (TIGR02999 family)